MEIQTIALMTRHSLDSDGTPIMPLYAISWTGEKDPPPQRKPRIRRNEPCACGSGKKYKKCCGGK